MVYPGKLISLGLFILRLGVGGFMLVHGVPKLINYSELANTFPDPLGLGSRLGLTLAIGAEVGCSLLLILGLGTRLASIPLAFTMAVAFAVVHGADPWKTKELAAMYLVIYVGLFFTGGGQYSLDGLFWPRRIPSVAETPGS